MLVEELRYNFRFFDFIIVRLEKGAKVTLDYEASFFRLLKTSRLKLVMGERRYWLQI